MAEFKDGSTTSLNGRYNVKYDIQGGGSASLTLLSSGAGDIPVPDSSFTSSTAFILEIAGKVEVSASNAKVFITAIGK
jgi:hypothetical protein